MGSAASLVREEMYKPLDGSDFGTLNDARGEIARLRTEMHRHQGRRNSQKGENGVLGPAMAGPAASLAEKSTLAASLVMRLYAERSERLGHTIDFATLRNRWGFVATEPSTSEVLDTAFQEEGPMRELMDTIRQSIGLPPDNKKYNTVFVYPADELSDASIPENSVKLAEEAAVPGDAGASEAMSASGSTAAMPPTPDACAAEAPAAAPSRLPSADDEDGTEEANGPEPDRIARSRRRILQASISCGGGRFLGGYVYFDGEWCGFGPATKIVGASRMIITEDADDEIDTDSYSLRLMGVEVVAGGFPHPHINAWGRGGEAAQGEMPETMHPAPSFIKQLVPGAVRWGYITPHEGRTLAARIDDAVLAGKDGSFVIELPGEAGGPHAVMYSMCMRRLLEDPPHVQKVRMPKRYVEMFANQYIEGKIPQPAGKPQRLLVLLGGSGAGKSTLLRFFENHGVDMAREWVLSGLDEFLEFVPEYRMATRDASVGYRTGADSCYRDAISIAIAVNKLCVARGIHLIIEDTGKDLKRTLAFIEQFNAFGRDITVALVDNDPNVAVTRALGRFQLTGRFASSEYIRNSFRDVFENYCTLKRRALKGEIRVSSFVYVDNSVHKRTRVWLDCEPGLPPTDGAPPPAGPILARSNFCQEPIEYRPHSSVLTRMLEHDARVRSAYQEFVELQLSSAKHTSKGRTSKSPQATS